MTLKRQVASGLFWVTFAQLIGRGLTFLTTLILAKLLTPSIFGLVGMAGLAINAIQLFQDIGFESALIYRRNEIEEASDTAFFTVIVTSLVIYAISAAGAPVVAAFFRQDDVTPILRVLALTTVISSFGRVPFVLLSRELDFRRRILPELAASVIGSIVAIILAFRGFGVWSLVWRELIRNAAGTILVWFVTGWRPRLRFSMRLARELFAYGKHVVSSQTLIFLITNIDNAIVGRYAGQAALGFYQFAYNISNTPATQITSIVNQVMFPALSRLAGEQGKNASAAELRARYYLTIVRYVTWITVPVAVAMILFAPEFIRGLYGETWAPVIFPLQCLAIYGLIRSIAANMGSVFRAMGKPQWLTYIAVWRLATMLITLYPITKLWGINGVGVLSVIVAVVDFIISATLVARLVDAPWPAYARMVIPSTVVALAAGFASHAVYPYLHLGKNALNLLAVGILLVVLYAGLLWLTDGRFRDAVHTNWRRLRGVALKRLQMR